jgi:hypothetical protein
MGSIASIGINQASLVQFAHRQEPLKAVIMIKFFSFLSFPPMIQNSE